VLLRAAEDGQVMVDYGNILGPFLESVKGTAQVTVINYRNKAEWFLLRPRILTEAEVFTRLERNWRVLVGPNASRFALLHVAGGQECGLWVHFLSTPQAVAEYEPGCHRLPAW
jgi:hypothetical protein